MPALKKCVPIEQLRAFLDRSLRILPQGATIFVVIDERPAMVLGPEVSFAAVDPDTLLAPLTLSPQFIGTLALRVPGLKGRKAERAHLAQTLEFLALSIEDMAEAEAGRRAIADETLGKYRDLALLHRAVFALNNTLKLKDTTQALLNECTEAAIPADVACVFLDTQGGHAFRPAQYMGSADIDLTPLLHGRLFNDICCRPRGEIINDLSHDPRWFNEVPEINALIMQPILSPSRCVGMLVLASTCPGPFKAAHLKHLGTLAGVAGIAVSNALNYEGIQVLMEALLQALAAAIDARDPFTAGHSERVASLAAAFAQAVSDDATLFPHITFTDDQVSEIYYAGILHDIGKIGIREEVLTKATRLPYKLLEIIRVRLELFGRISSYPWQRTFERLSAINAAVTPSDDDLNFIATLAGLNWQEQGIDLPLLHDDERDLLSLPYGNLTAAERQEIERHPAEAFRILQPIPFQDNFRNLRAMIRQHHERLDGSGYPDGLKGDEILLQSRILTIADIYDAITQERHYKPAASRSAALQTLRDESTAGRLDADLVALFCGRLDAIQKAAAQFKHQRLRTLPH